MKFTCSRQDLAKSLNIVSKAVSVRTTIPSLKGIMMEVKDGALIMTASDMDITIQDRIQVEQAEAGSVIVPAKLFGDVVRKLAGEEIAISADESSTIEVKCLNSDFILTGIQADEFVNIKNTDANATELVLDRHVFSEMVKSTSFAASIDQTKGVITGILTELDNDHLRMVAIDGYRMAIATAPAVSQEAKKIIISARIMNEIVKILADTEERAEEETMKITVDAKSAVLETGKTKVIMRLIAGDFIRYQDIIPHESAIRVFVNRKELAESVDRASLLSKEGRNNLIKLAIRDNVLTITSRSEEGNVKEDVLIQKEGDDLDIGFNAKYMTDMLRAINDDEIVMNFNSSRTPCLVTPKEGDAYEYLVLPVRISNM